ncbi:MAG: zf-HC2 domain-containing protein [Chloroflexi bacterium]|nr:zf-HC2 domain-containing protein [Chloroflexota bacterium]
MDQAVAHMSGARHLSEDQRAEYVDGRMAAETRAAMERHLGTCVACQAGVEQDRAVVALLRRLPALEPPRSFALPAPVVRPAWARTAAWTRLASGLAAAFLVVLLGVDLLAPPRTAAPAFAPAADLRSTALSAGKLAQETAPRSAAPAPAATAAPAAAAAPAGPTAAPARAAPAAAPAAKPAAKPAEQPAPALQAGALAPEQSAAAPQPQAAPAPAGVEARKASEAGAPAAPLADTSAASRAEEGRLQAMGTPAPLPEEQAQPGPTWGLRQWEALFAALALLLGGTAFVLGRRAG